MTQINAFVKEYCSRLKKCPFCGSNDAHVKYVHNPYDIYGGYRAMCRNCSAMTDICDLPEFAAAKWNMRADTK